MKTIVPGAIPALGPAGAGTPDRRDDDRRPPRRAGAEIPPPDAPPTGRRPLPSRAAAMVWACAALALMGVWPDAAEAGRRVIVADGTADPSTRALAATMALFPAVAVAVFALASLLDRPRR